MSPIARKLCAALIITTAASTAYAYEITAQKSTNDMRGNPVTTYTIKCNSGSTVTINKTPYYGGQWVYQATQGNGTQYKSLDPAAKAACKE